MTKNLRILLPSLALALAIGTGCMLISGQFIVNYTFPDASIDVTNVTVVPVDVDLNTNGTYKDHKGDLKDLADVALLGVFTNTGTQPVSIEIWMTPSLTTFTTADQVTTAAGAVPVWGPFTLAAGETKHITWNQSARLFRNKAALLSEIKGDGTFTLYALGTGATTYSFRVEHGVLVAVIDAGK